MLTPEELDTADGYGKDLDKILSQAFLSGKTYIILKDHGAAFPYLYVRPVVYVKLIHAHRWDDEALELLAIINEQWN